MPRPLKPVEACGCALLRMLLVFPASIDSSSVIEPFSVLGPWGTSSRRPAREGSAASKYSHPHYHNPNRCSAVMPSTLPRRSRQVSTGENAQKLQSKYEAAREGGVLCFLDSPERQGWQMSPRSLKRCRPAIVGANIVSRRAWPMLGLT